MSSGQLQPGSMGPPTQTFQGDGAVLEALAAKMPKGLRVEDLKPPPAKRQKGVKGVASPSSNTQGQTPEAARTPRTPQVASDSPGQPGSSKKTAAAPTSGSGNKRKRQSSVAKTPRSLLAEAKEEKAGRMSKSHAATVPIPTPARDNALGINIDPASLDLHTHAPFFATQRALHSAMSAATSGADIWATLSGVMEEKKKSDEELFATYLNTADLVEDEEEGEGGAHLGPAWTQPTPELFRVGSREEGSISGEEWSPESVRTVGNGATPVAPGVGVGVGRGGKGDSGLVKGEYELEVGLEEAEADEVELGWGSPMSRAYNGSILVDRDNLGIPA